MDTMPELREIFALGSSVKVSGRDISIEIGSSGIESISEAELQRIKAAW
jgi:hypothetical protein